MKILEKIASRFGYMKSTDIGNIVSQLFITGERNITSDKEYYQLVDAFKSWVYTCIDKIGKSVAMLPLRLYIYRRKGTKIIDPHFKMYLKSIQTQSEKKYYLKQVGVEREEVTEHPWLALMNKPNSIMTRFMLWYETLIRLELGGVCGWYMVKNGLKIPKEIWPLPLTKYARLEPKINPDMTLSEWEYTDGHIIKSFRPDEILFLHYPNPASPYKGMSPLMAQSYPYDIDLFLMQQQRALFDNMAMPGLILSTDQKLIKTQVNEIKSNIVEEYTTALKAGRNMVLHSGLKPVNAALTSRDAMIDEVARFAREKLISSFDLSEGKLGLVRDVNRANMDALNETFINECQRPKCMLIEEAIETFMLPLYDQGLTCDFELPDIERTDQKLVERKQNLETLYSSVNQERAKEGLEAVPWGDVPWIPFTLTQMGTTNNPPPAKEVKPEQKSMTTDFWTDERLEMAWKVFVRRSEHLESLVLGQAQGYFRILQHEVTDRLRDYGRRISGMYAGWSRQKIEKHIADGNNKSIDDININKKREMERISSIFTPVIKILWDESGQARMKDLVSGVFFNVNDPRALVKIGDRMEMFSKEVTGNTFDSIRAILRDGFSEGQPVQTIADTLMQKFESWEKYRASLIARTETISALNSSDLEAVQQAGMDKQLLKHWLSSRDSHVRDTHLEADQRYRANGIPIDETFEVGGDSMLAPGEGNDPAEVCNCRCTLYYTEIKEK